MPKTISHEDARREFWYSKTTGKLHRWVEGELSEVGWLDRKGYRRFKYKDKTYSTHRFAWFWVTGEWPDEVDHENHDTADNRWDNLRDGTHGFNTQNQTEPHSHNRTGLLGVSPIGRKYRAQIKVNGVVKHLGLRADPMEAHALYVEAKRRLHEGNTL